jgi:hypothetical protein
MCIHIYTRVWRLFAIFSPRSKRKREKKCVENAYQTHKEEREQEKEINVREVFANIGGKVVVHCSPHFQATICTAAPLSLHIALRSDK